MISSASFAHVVATRIGIGVYDENWFAYRLQLFEAITVPSMVAQSSRDFTWMLVIDKNMPSLARQRLDQAVSKLDNAVITPVEFKIDLREAIVRCAKQRAVAAGADYVLTSRLDDDDALRVNAFERLHSDAAGYLRNSRQRYAVFSFNLGCMWLPSHRVGFTRYHPSHSIGISIMEPSDECEGVHNWRHLKIKHDNAARGTYFGEISGDTLWWLYTTHYLADSEAGNRRRMDKIVSHPHGYRLDDSLLGEFGIDPGSIDEFGQRADPETARSTKSLWVRAGSVEREIRRCRKQLARTSRFHVPRRIALRWQLRRLQRHRRMAGSGIVRDE